MVFQGDSRSVANMPWPGQQQVSNVRPAAFQAGHAGSIPVARSTRESAGESRIQRERDGPVPWPIRHAGHTRATRGRFSCLTLAGVRLLPRRFGGCLADLADQAAERWLTVFLLRWGRVSLGMVGLLAAEVGGVGGEMADVGAGVGGAPEGPPVAEQVTHGRVDDLVGGPLSGQDEDDPGGAAGLSQLRQVPAANWLEPVG